MKIKKFTSVLLSALIFFGSLLLVPLNAGAVEENIFRYNITSAGTAVISDYRGKDKEVVIPGAIDGYPVTAIGRYAFSYNKYIENITIPKGVTSIGFSAFAECENLTKVSIPDTVTSIRSYAFEDDFKLCDIKLPSKITSIESNLFSGTGIKSINIPDTVKIIENSAFIDCEKLESIELPDSVKEISSFSFADCKSLQSVKLSKNIKVIPEYAFSGTENLSKISLPSKVTKISRSAFAGSGIKSIKISKNINKIDDNAFYSCSKLTAINVDSKNMNYCSSDGVLYNKKKTVLITYPAGKSSTKFTVNKNIKTVKSNSFVGNAKLESVTFKKGVTKIGNGAFMQTFIKKVKLPSSLKTIGSSAFEGCENLENVYIPTSVTSIKYNAFAKCTALKTLDFKGNSSLSMERGVFEGCLSLKSVSAPIAKSCGGRTFFACTKLTKVSFSKDVKKIFKEDYAECTNLNTVKIPATVKKIATRAFGYINYYDYSFDKNDNLLIKGYKNTAAYKYAKENDFEFKKLNKST